METSANTPTGASGWDKHPNLRLGLGGAKGKGRLQRQIQRAFAILGPEVSSSQLFDWCYARKRQKLSQRHRYSVWRILNEIAEKVGHSRGPGRPWIWRLRDDRVLTAPSRTHPSD